MKTLRFLFFLILFIPFRTYGQENKNELTPGKVKIFVYLMDNTNKELSGNQIDKVRSRLINLVNESGIAEIGYSNFLLYPNVLINDIKLDENGLSKLYVASCDLNLYVARIQPGESGAAGIYSSYSKQIRGVGATKEAAIQNAINSIKSNDEGIINFIKEAKNKIVQYFTEHCNDVLKEAERLNDLQDYTGAISLFFSIPDGASCYSKAYERSIGVYDHYLTIECNKQMMELKSLITLASNKSDNSFDDLYNDILEKIEKINPVASCYGDINALLQSLDNKLSAKQKQDYELLIVKQKNENELQRELIKGMENVYRNQTLPNNIIVNH